MATRMSLGEQTKATKNPFLPDGEDATELFCWRRDDEQRKVRWRGRHCAKSNSLRCKASKNVVFRNHQIDLNSEVAIAMGDYVSTDATSGDEVRVEYTFGWQRCADGKPRIFLHHSSVPYQ